MPELRWILLVVGALVVAGLWWWESRRSRAARAARDGAAVEPGGARGGPASAVSAQRAEPSLGGELGTADGPVDVASIRMAPDERRPIGLNPPVMTIDDLPDDPLQVELSDQAPSRPIEPSVARLERAPEPAGRAADSGGRAAGSVRSTSVVAGAAMAETSRRAGGSGAPKAPVSSGLASMPGLTNAPAPAPACGSGDRSSGPVGAAERHGSADRVEGASRPAVDPAARQQRIVAIRLLARADQPVDGAELRAALEAEGMRFGKYSIFHRLRADGRPAYSAASLVEPGSFELDQMDKLLYPGLSLFAVFPGPVEAPEGFEELLAAARRLADRLEVSIQDERGAPMTAQRALAIREELAHFQGLVARLRQRS